MGKKKVSSYAKSFTQKSQEKKNNVGKGKGRRRAVTDRRLKMYKTRAKRNSKGKIVFGNEFQSSQLPCTRIQPDRRWFQNAHVISQKDLEVFRNKLTERTSDNYQVILGANNLPLSLLN